MSYISTGVEYALHCLLFLIGQPEDATPPSARDLAALQGVSADYLAKLFTRLQQADLVVSREGALGGVRLARAARDISVLDVVVAIDGDRAFFDCQEIRGRCALFGDAPPAWATRGTCSIHAVMIEAERKAKAALAAHSLADLAGRVAAKAPMELGGMAAQWLSDRAANRKPGRVARPLDKQE